MPEGDAIFRAARTLHRALAGRQVVRFESALPALTRVHEDTPVTGRTVESVTARGKHILMRFSGDLVLHTHMRMSGSWHIYRPGERWRRPRRDMRVIVATDAFEAIAFTVPIAEFLTSRDVARQEDLRTLGPDLLGASFDEQDAMRRFRARPLLSIADALINQRIVAGAGNIYKSEVLFLCRVDPFTTVAQVTDAQLAAILATARKFLQANVTTLGGGITTYIGYRRTRRHEQRSERVYVYGRAGQPCRRCGAKIEVKAQGPNARLTYWCPRCQG